MNLIICSPSSSLPFRTLAEDISAFLENTQQLMEWLNEVEREMQKYEDPSTEPEELGTQSDELAVGQK